MDTNSKIYDICSLGSASNDLTVLVPRLPVEGETLQALEEYHANGGKVLIFFIFIYFLISLML